jgi:hypothetical protein
LEINHENTVSGSTSVVFISSMSRKLVFSSGRNNMRELNPNSTDY